MQPEEKREIVEAIADKIIVGKDEITINLCYAPSCKDMANRWRKGWFLNPFCHLVINAVRVDSNSCLIGRTKSVAHTTKHIVKRANCCRVDAVRRVGFYPICESTKPKDSDLSFKTVLERL